MRESLFAILIILLSHLRQSEFFSILRWHAVQYGDAVTRPPNPTAIIARVFSAGSQTSNVIMPFLKDP